MRRKLALPVLDGVKGFLLALVLFVIVSRLHGQGNETRRIGAAVSYLSSGNVYIDAGRDRGLAVGDTLTITRASVLLARVVVMAISSGSSSAQVVSQIGAIAVGDSAFIRKELPKVSPAPSSVQGPVSSTFFAAQSGEAEKNIVSGRIALQYAGAGSPGSSVDFSQPSALVRLDVTKLFGTQLKFSMYGRSYYDLSDQFRLYAEGSRLKFRMYEMSFSFDDPRAWYGYSLGRLTSRFVGGLGSFDGGQFFVQRGNVAAGVLAGSQADPRTSGVDMHQQKVAGFINFSWGGDVFRPHDVTIAYGRQLNKGKLDRDFLYLQGSTRLGSDLNMYASSEFDFHTINGGIKTNDFHLTNMFLSVSYRPLNWLSTTAGYDATRNIYLFETMKEIPDTLLDSRLQQGIRVGVTFRFPLNITLSGTANVRVKQADTRNARTLGAGLRISDIAQSEFNVGAQYSDVRGLYTEGKDMTFDLDRWFSSTMSVALRFDRNRYTVVAQDSRFATSTASMILNYRISRAWYSVLSVDRVWDTVGNSIRVYSEIGFHF